MLLKRQSLELYPTDGQTFNVEFRSTESVDWSVSFGDACGIWWDNGDPCFGQIFFNNAPMVSISSFIEEYTVYEGVLAEEDMVIFMLRDINLGISLYARKRIIEATHKQWESAKGWSIQC